MNDLWSQLFNFTDYGELLALVRNSIFAGAVLGVVGGLIGVFVMQRDMAFAVHGISELIDRRRRDHDSAVVFVTHDVNPVLGMVDRVLYLAGGRFREGTPDEVLRSDVLTDLYGTPVEVIRSRGRIVVVGIPDAETHDHHAHERTAHPEPAS